ncbi:hypothetical protein CRG98_037772 [Punica granatum]|uniref:Uncharacterized protein n=1 Tax=Punica granatum TaxID=22663 RepID=A0A2I0ICX4_PUNGR|nr:hypothetical protein CRG98_037772 [Punica granatum]
MGRMGRVSQTGSGRNGERRAPITPGFRGKKTDSSLTFPLARPPIFFPGPLSSRILTLGFTRTPHLLSPPLLILFLVISSPRAHPRPSDPSPTSSLARPDTPARNTPEKFKKKTAVHTPSANPNTPQLHPNSQSSTGHSKLSISLSSPRISLSPGPSAPLITTPHEPPSALSRSLQGAQSHPANRTSCRSHPALSLRCCLHQSAAQPGPSAQKPSPWSAAARPTSSSSAAAIKQRPSPLLRPNSVQQARLAKSSPVHPTRRSAHSSPTHSSPAQRSSGRFLLWAVRSDPIRPDFIRRFVFTEKPLNFPN